MTLLDRMKVPCVCMTVTSSSDGMGGRVNAWTEGAAFDAVIRKVSTPEDVVAQQQEAAETFIVVVDSSVQLAYHDVIKRLTDNAIFRITSYTLDAAAPPPSTVQIAKATAERWVLA